VGGRGVLQREKWTLCSIYAISPIYSSMDNGTSAPHPISSTRLPFRKVAYPTCDVTSEMV
jgi:hypothetical protein